MPEMPKFTIATNPNTKVRCALCAVRYYTIIVKYESARPTALYKEVYTQHTHTHTDTELCTIKTESEITCPACLLYPGIHKRSEKHLVDVNSTFNIPSSHVTPSTNNKSKLL